MIFVAESGVKEPQDVGVLAEIGADAVLIGEALMRAEDKTERLAEFKQAAAQKRLWPQSRTRCMMEARHDASE